MQKLLVVEPAERQRISIRGRLESRAAGIEIVFARSLNEAMSALRGGGIGCVLSAANFPHDKMGGPRGSAVDLLAAMKREQHYQPVIVHSDNLEAEEKRALIEKGAVAVFERDQLTGKTLHFLLPKISKK